MVASRKKGPVELFDKTCAGGLRPGALRQAGQRDYEGLLRAAIFAERVAVFGALGILDGYRRGWGSQVAAPDTRG